MTVAANQVTTERVDAPATFLREGERLLLASNRLPVTVQRDEHGVRAQMSSGGIATGLSHPHREGKGLWIGWPGAPSPDGTLDAEVQGALAEQGMVGIALTPEEHEAYYNRTCNRVLWPLFHYFTHNVTFRHDDWQVYERVNRRFADALLEHARPSDIVFVHDFHLLLVPAMLREALPELRIGFFLHIPFPSSEIYRILPTRAAALRGMLGADMIGFHTLDYVRHFRSALRRVLGLDVRSAEVLHEGRRVRLLAEPLGIVPEEWQERGRTPEVAAEVARLREAAAGRRVILGVDRLDYTKGIPNRLRAFGELLRSDPSLVDRVMMIQVAVPSRVEVEEYRRLKDEVDRIAGRINGEFGRPRHVPLHYYFRSVPPAVLGALYQVADVALVTPLRDGLNLVAKEYVAARQRDDGVLIIGEFTGAAWELGEAIHVNPYDPVAMAGALRRALEMSPEEQARRMAPMRERVRRNNVHVWVRHCVDAIRDAQHLSPTPLLAGEVRRAEEERWRQSRQRHLFLDYDGTLREFEPTPEAAAPTPEVLQLLNALTQVSGVSTWVVSGRPPQVLEQWLGATGCGFVAEHGAFLRRPGEHEFKLMFRRPPETWRPLILEVMRRFADRVPGSHIEEKPLGVAWHYRQCDPVLSSWQARELFQHLDEFLSSEPLEVIHGSKVIEVRPMGMDKGTAVHILIRETAQASDFVLAAGDDTTDEDIFRLCGKDALTLLVGERESAARYRVPDPAAMRQLLRDWLALLPQAQAAAAEAGRRR